MLVIGDSVLAMLAPRRHVSLWLDGPRWWQRTCEPFIRHPMLTRTLGVAGLGVGIWLARRQEPRLLPGPRLGTGRGLPRRVFS